MEDCEEKYIDENFESFLSVLCIEDEVFYEIAKWSTLFMIILAITCCLLLLKESGAKLRRMT